MDSAMKKSNKLPGVFTRLSLKKITQAALLVAVFMLLTVSTLAVREWYLHAHFSRLLNESMLIRAHFTELSEYLTEQLLANKVINIDEIEHEAEIIGKKGSDLALQTLIPEEFKLLLISGNDMTKLMARVRLLSTQPDGTDKHLTIYRMLSDINSRIAGFHDGFCRYVQQQRQAIQNLLRGSLAMATVFLAMLLFLLHVHVTKPFFQLINNLRKGLSQKTQNSETVDSILSITNLGNRASSELAACSIYKHIFKITPDFNSTDSMPDQPEGSVWKLVTPLLKQFPHYKLVLTSFFTDDRVRGKIPDYLVEEVQSRGAVIFPETDDLTFSRIRKILPYSKDIHTGICFSIVSASGLSGMVTILSDNPESFSDQEVASLSALLRFFEYIDSAVSSETSSGIGFTLDELRGVSLSLLNELPPHRGCHNIMNHANGIINCAQILKDQEDNVDLQEDENQKLMTDLWQSGKKIADTVTHLRSLQQLYNSPVTSIEDAIALLVSWLELQFPEVPLILEQKSGGPLPAVRIPARDLFLAMALQAEQVIPEPGHDHSFCVFSKLLIETYVQTETEVIIEMILQLESGELPVSEQNSVTHIRQLISNDLLTFYGSAFEVSRGTDQTIKYRFLLR